MYSNGANGGSNLDMCGKCSNNSREALHKKNSTEGNIERNSFHSSYFCKMVNDNISFLYNVM